METIPEPSENRFLVDMKERGDFFGCVAMARRDKSRIISSCHIFVIMDFKLAMLLGSEVFHLER